jgi:CBS domain-containing protein
MLISQILKDKPTQGVVTVPSGTPMSDVANILSEHRIGGVIVSDDGEHPLGIVTERDIVRELGKRGTDCMNDTADEMMTTPLVSCLPGDRAIRVLQQMTEGRFRHMPVMEGDRMVGLVSIGDVVKARLDELANQAESLKNMIMGY